MALFGSKKNKPSEGAELVLAYLEDAQRVRTPFTLTDPRGRETTASLVSVLEEKVVLGTPAALPLDKGATLTLTFILDGLRLRATTRLLETRAGSTTVELPSELALAERRRRPRARMNPREGATVTALTGLFDGVGITGTLENLGETGLCMRVDRALEVKTQRKMHLGPNLLQVGQPLMLVKLAKVPKCPPLELAGTVAHLDASQGLVVGITFEPGKEALLAPIRALVASRAGALPTALPPKARRSAEPAVRDEDPPGHRATAPAPRDPEPPARPAPEPPPPAAPAVAPAPAPPVPETPPAPVVDERAQALLRVKKRARGILLAMAAGPEREALAAFLQADGYGRVVCAETLTELLAATARPGIHLALVDGGVAELRGLALAAFLSQGHEEDHPRVILAEGAVDAALVLGAREAGVAQILVKPYALDAELQRTIEEHLGIG